MGSGVDDNPKSGRTIPAGIAGASESTPLRGPGESYSGNAAHESGKQQAAEVRDGSANFLTICLYQIVMRTGWISKRKVSSCRPF